MRRTRSRLGYYDHLNLDTPVRIEGVGMDVELTGEHHMDALVRAVRRSNYGLHRFLTAYVRQHEHEEFEAEICAEFKSMIERGLY